MNKTGIEVLICVWLCHRPMVDLGPWLSRLVLIKRSLIRGAGVVTQLMDSFKTSSVLCVAVIFASALWQISFDMLVDSASASPSPPPGLCCVPKRSFSAYNSLAPFLSSAPAALAASW